MRGIENNDRVGDFTVERDCNMKGHGIRKVAGNNFTLVFTKGLKFDIVGATIVPMLWAIILKSS